jgi:mannitol/fructose-specific phosphotransferase system IIA component (Ntr-type)
MKRLLNEIFDVRSITINLQGKAKEPVLTELIGSIADLYPDFNRTEMLEKIMEREEKMSTGIGGGFAIPHAFCTGIGSMAGAIGISQSGIEYGALDNKPVHVIFLLAVNGGPNENHLRVLNRIFDLAQSEAYQIIKKAKDPQDIHRILLNL